MYNLLKQLLKFFSCGDMITFCIVANKISKLLVINCFLFKSANPHASAEVLFLLPEQIL